MRARPARDACHASEHQQAESASGGADRHETILDGSPTAGNWGHSGATHCRATPAAAARGPPILGLAEAEALREALAAGAVAADDVEKFRERCAPTAQALRPKLQCAP